MKLGVVALDYDGTIAEHGAMHPAVRVAIAEARQRGIAVVLVTGRILDELRQVAGDLRFVNAVVAENGAVLAFPATGYVRILGPAPSPAFVAELRRRGVAAKSGQVIVEADTEHAPAILDAIQAQQLPLTLLFNRDRVMVLPQAVNKATGLRELLRMLRRSEHDALAVGDAENDHALLEACEIGAAVSWGSPALKNVADEIIEGDGPVAVAAYIQALASDTLLLPQRTSRHRIVLGADENGDPVTLASGSCNLVIGGDPHSGKSWLAGLLCEQLILQRYGICIIDSDGDHGPLGSLPGVTILGGDQPVPTPGEVVRTLRYPDVSVVVDLSRARLPDRRVYIASLLEALRDLRRRTGLPHRIVVDGAHDLLHDPSSRARLDLDLCGYAIVTERISEVHPEIMVGCQSAIVTRVTDARETEALIRRAGDSSPLRMWAGPLATLPHREAALLPSRDLREAVPRPFHLMPRLSGNIRDEAR